MIKNLLNKIDIICYIKIKNIIIINNYNNIYIFLLKFY